MSVIQQAEYVLYQPLDLEFLRQPIIGPVVYGMGGCGHHLNLSPAPVCLPVWNTEQPETWVPPTPPEKHPVSTPGTAMLVGSVLVIFILNRIQRKLDQEIYMEDEE